MDVSEKSHNQQLDRVGEEGWLGVEAGTSWQLASGVKITLFTRTKSLMVLPDLRTIF
jgi:hypothetical protein